MTRIIALFSFGIAAALFAASQTEAQPGKGGKGPGAGGADVQKLERDLDRLLEQVKDTKAALAKAKEAGGKKSFEGFKGKKGFEDFKGNKGFGGKGFGGKGDFKKGFEPMKQFGKGKGEAKLDPETIKERYEYYKKLYDALPKGKGKGFEGKGKGFEGKGKGKGFESKRPEPMPEPKGKGKGKGPEGPAATPSRNVEARIDALIRELETLRSEVRGAKKK